MDCQKCGSSPRPHNQQRGNDPCCAGWGIGPPCRPSATNSAPPTARLRYSCTYKRGVPSIEAILTCLPGKAKSGSQVEASETLHGGRKFKGVGDEVSTSIPPLHAKVRDVMPSKNGRVPMFTPNPKSCRPFTTTDPTINSESFTKTYAESTRAFVKPINTCGST